MLQHRDHLRKIAAKWLARFRAQLDGVTFLEREAAKTVPFRLVLPRAVINRQRRRRCRLHRLCVERQPEFTLVVIGGRFDYATCSIVCSSWTPGASGRRHHLELLANTHRS